MTRDLARIVLRGDPSARGRQYGMQAQRKIVRCIESYRAVFRHRAGLQWDAALAHARSFEGSIAEFLPDALLEMRGIAEGAAVPFDHILALNCRSELMFAARPSRPDDCTSFAVLPEANDRGHMLVGQNWDWVPFALDVCVLVEVRRADRPSFASIVEAGMLAKVGFNEARVGLCTNTLVSKLDGVQDGVPYHVMLRALLDAADVAEAARILHSTRRALSANYLVADATGRAVNFECAPGGPAEIRTSTPDLGVIAHANHFVDETLSETDYYVDQNPHSVTRLASMQRGLQASRISIERLKSLLRTHDGAPNGICGHPAPGGEPWAARSTIASVIMDLTAGEAWFTVGPPCESEYVGYRFA